MNYGKKLKEMRTLELIPQKEIAKSLGINRSTYKDYELQIRILPIKHLNKICEIFNISVDYLFDFTDIKNYETKRNIDLNLLATRLKEFRKENKLTQVDLAKILNTSHSMISEYEKNIKIISLANLYTLCNKYKISADYLLGRIDDKIIFNK